MSAYETVASGRSKRSTAGNRMRELLEKAHQEDDDELFAEVEDDEEFEAPQDQRDVYLEDFADTDEEVEMDEEEQERQLRREEKRKAKGKNKAYNPLVPTSAPKVKQARFDNTPTTSSTEATAAAATLLDATFDPSSMAPSTLLLALRKQRREAKRANRSEARRSNLRASTLRTEAEIAEREKEEKKARESSRKGRRAQHETGEVRGARPMTQDELIAAALEEEERNKEALSAWIRREEERRELRRVGRKRVRGPRWTWISRTVGRLVEVVEDGEKEVVEVLAGPSETSKMPAKAVSPLDEENRESEVATTAPRSGLETSPENSSTINPVLSDELPSSDTAPEVKATERPGPASDGVTEAAETNPATTTATTPTTASQDPEQPERSADKPPDPAIEDAPTATAMAPTVEPKPAPEAQASTDISKDADTRPATATATATESSNSTNQLPAQSAPSPTSPFPPMEVEKTVQPDQDSTPKVEEVEASRYTRNYLVLSQIPGGLSEELKVILGDHVKWDQVQFIPSRNRPINRRPPTCPFTGLPAKYRHPLTLTPYATAGAYKEIEALLQNRYVWNGDMNCWVGGEEDACAEGVEGVDGWWEAMNGGWLGGREIEMEPEAEAEALLEIEVAEMVHDQDQVEQAEEEEITLMDSKSNSKSKSKGKGKGNKRKRGGENELAIATGTPGVGDGDTPVPKKSKAKGKKR